MNSFWKKAEDSGIFEQLTCGCIKQAGMFICHYYIQTNHLIFKKTEISTYKADIFVLIILP